MLSYALVDAFTHAGRRDAMTRLKSAIANADGVIVDFAFFSDGAIRLSVELEAGALAALSNALEANGIRLFERSAAELARSRDVLPSRKLVVALLHVAFMAEDPRELTNSSLRDAS